jgi:hypothetical protein
LENKKQSVIGKGKEEEDTYPSESASEWMNEQEMRIRSQQKESILWVVTDKNDYVFFKHERLKNPNKKLSQSFRSKG